MSEAERAPGFYWVRFEEGWEPVLFAAGFWWRATVDWEGPFPPPVLEVGERLVHGTEPSSKDVAPLHQRIERKA